MALPVKTYGYINAKLRAQLSKRISPEQYSRMAKASNITEALQVLEGTLYSGVFDHYHETGDMKMVERELIGTEIEMIRKLRAFLEPEVEAIIDMFLEQYEMKNVKDALRYWFDRSVRERDVDNHVIYMLKGNILREIDYSSIIYAPGPEDAIKELVSTPYYPAVNRHLADAAASGSLYILECELENQYFLRFMEAINNLDPKDRERAKKIVGIQIDMENISRLSRYTRFFSGKREGKGVSTEVTPFVAGGKSIPVKELQFAVSAGDPKEMLKKTVGTYYKGARFFDHGEKGQDMGDTFFVLFLSVLQEIFISEVKKLLLGYPFTIGIVLAYCFIRQNEINKIIKVLNGKLYGLQDERIEEMI